MKRGIRDSKEPAQEGAQVQELYEAYRGRSEDELMAELSRMSASERAQLDTLAKELSPMLNAAQKQRLASILNALRS